MVLVVCSTGANRGAPSLEAATGGPSGGLDIMSLERLTAKYFNWGAS